MIIQAGTETEQRIMTYQATRSHLCVQLHMQQLNGHLRVGLREAL